ncbi:tripartite tricarboxylate transporter substrate binding protein [Rhodoferax sp. BAB1]|uniref:Bug family tripartite tricarboxylate transporter substrate binding protein n=1 Tax=Rhodoferax sp. BAB1 TaxID=2741720 RepID=UPI00157600C0|nr:tripartite tricarboxylate transporter substrate binding protein [Rhodoferax sp. BAB1]QKO20641.1 tripartite tricarboxylate transporter substrate binding protein [Rhodoferax sp. BAB1]
MKRVLISAALLLCAGVALAQGYPSKPIRIVVPFTAGSATDIMARIVGEKLGAAWGQTVVVENKPGAGGTVGSAFVAKSEPDGYTLLVVSTGHVVNPVLYPGLSYDTVGDFAGITPLASLPNVLVVGANSPIKNVPELIAAAKANPGKLNYASAGTGSATHVNAEKFRAITGIQATHIPFKGTPETITETVAGRVDFMFTPVLSSIPMIRDNRMRALAVSTAQRSSALPEVPTVAEAAVPGFVFDFWIGLLAPAKTPRDVVNKLNQEVNKALNQPDVKERMAKLGGEPLPMTPERFDAFIREEHATLSVIMKGAK